MPRRLVHELRLIRDVTRQLLALLTVAVISSSYATSDDTEGRLWLVNAAEKQAWTKLNDLPREPEVLNATQADGMTALHWATWHDEAAVVRALLSAGAQADVKNEYGVRPLNVACTNGNLEIVDALLKAGADPHQPLHGGETPLMTAARNGRLEVVQKLIDAQVDTNARERKGQTALMWAASAGHADVVAALLNAGADYRAELSSGFTALDFAAREGRTVVVEKLIAAGADPKRTVSGKRSSGKAPRSGTAPLILAIENGHYETALLLVRSGADPNDQRTGFAPLHTLSWVRKPNRGDGDDGDPPPPESEAMTSLDFVRALVQLGADVNLRLEKGGSGTGVLTRRGATPFFMAAITDDLPYMQVLLELGADPKITNAEGATTLMAAAGVGALAPEEMAGTEEEALDAVKFLAALGLDVNAVDNNGETAMHGAAYKNVPRVVVSLHELGASRVTWNRKNKYGWTPLDIAEGRRPGNFKPSVETATAIQRILEQ